MSPTTAPSQGWIDSIIEFSVRRRWLVIGLAALLALAGGICLARAPVDAIPDLSENQVIVFADWPGHAPQEVEDQITFPLSSRLQGLEGVKAVRASSELDFSMIDVIFEDGVGFRAARARVEEKLLARGDELPAGVKPYLAPDATALGQIVWYTVEGGDGDLAALRALQDFTVRPQLAALPGVAEVASVGGFVREFQVDVDPVRLRSAGISVGEVFSALAAANGAAGGGVVEKSGRELVVRGHAYVKTAEDLELAVITTRKGVPILLRQVASVKLGPAPRRSLLEKDGGEAVGGVVLMRAGENPLEVTGRVRAKLAGIQRGLPAGIRLVPFYERTRLIRSALGTLRRTLIEEIVACVVMVLLILGHLRSSLVVVLTLPVAVLASFVLMRLFGISSNIMSLSGIAIAIGVLADSAIVMTENALTRLHEAAGGKPVTGDTRVVVLRACKVVGKPLFFSVLITAVSFLPVFALTGMEGKMFHPLAWTKTFALGSVALLAITLVPALIPGLVRGRLRGEEESRLVRGVLSVYRPVLLFFLEKPRLVLASLALLCAVGAVIAPRLGTEFMPALDEGALVDMPVTVPSVAISEARRDLVARDRVLRSFPEVQRVVGKAGRADTPTDPAQLDMIETMIELRPKERWPRRALPESVFQRAAQASLGSASKAAAVAAEESRRRFDARMRELASAKLSAADRRLGEELVRAAVEGAARAAGSGAEARVAAASGPLVATFGPRFAQGPLLADVESAAAAVAQSILPGDPSARARAVEAAPGILETLEERRERRAGVFADAVDDELEDASAATLSAALADAGVPGPHDRVAHPLLARKSKVELTDELDAALRMPGWGNIWTEPIINRVDMLATGVRTAVGVKVSGPDLAQIEGVAGQVAEALRAVPGAVDVVPERNSGKEYVEIAFDRARAAVAGATAAQVNDAIEMALGGKRASIAVDGRGRAALRVRYALDGRADEGRVGQVLVDRAQGGPVPLEQVALVRRVRGPSMIKSENGFLRALVQLNVRGRDLVGFVEEARRAVAARVTLPPGVFLEWSGQFEHQLSARRTLSLVFPLVLLAIFAILWLAYRDLRDAVLMMLAVPGALVGGVLVQWMFGFHFSVAVWIGYIACFGLATETGIVLLVYLREAIERRGGLAALESLEDLREAVIAGSLQRLRPKLLTEGLIVLSVLPMLWATGAGAEILRPMAAPVLGGILVADEVIDITIPVLFYWERRRRWLKTRRSAGGGLASMHG